MSTRRPAREPRRSPTGRTAPGRIRSTTGRSMLRRPTTRPPARGRSRRSRPTACRACVHQGDSVWRSVLGLNERLPEGKQLVGGSGSAGPTVTAGGLVFVGATSDQRFRAFDAKTGKELWVTRLPGAGNANPMTYTGKNGKQYVAIVSGGTVNVFTLP